MNGDHVDGKWNGSAGSGSERWGKFTHDECRFVGDEKDRLLGWNHERYEIVKTEAEKQVDEWFHPLNKL